MGTMAERSPADQAEAADARGSARRLAEPVHFVCPEDRIWPELRDGTPLPLPGDVLARRAVGIPDTWVQRTYHALKAAGEPVTLSRGVEPDRINVAAVRDFGKRLRLTPGFVVIPRADAHAPALGNFVIRQNGLARETAHSANIPHWPQPGLIPRDAARGARIETVAFKGHALNLWAPFRSEAFREALAAMEIRLDLDLRDMESGAQRWHDYSETDVVLAIRNQTAYDARHKPASKLVNAWAAGAPALLGPEPAFAELRRDPLDYVEIRSPEDALAALRRFRDQPRLYTDSIANGMRRAADYTDAAVLERWIDVLNGKVTPAYRHWRARPRALRALQVAGMIALEPLSQRLHHARATRGPRLLS